jgi:calcium uniporter protein, mitochondrial
LLTIHKAAQKIGLNLEEYNLIKRNIAEIEHDLQRLRDPLCMHLPAPPPKTPNYSATEIARSKKQTADQLQGIYDGIRKNDGRTSSDLLRLGKIIDSATKRLKK